MRTVISTNGNLHEFEEDMKVSMDNLWPRLLVASSGVAGSEVISQKSNQLILELGTAEESRIMQNDILVAYP